MLATPSPTWTPAPAPVWTPVPAPVPCGDSAHSAGRGDGILAFAVSLLVLAVVLSGVVAMKGGRAPHKPPTTAASPASTPLASPSP